MLEARLAQASTLKKLLDAVKELVQDANFECNDDGIALQAMDNSHVALVSVLLKESGFESYRCDRSMPLGINLASLTKILKCAKDDDVVTLKAADDADSLGLMFEGTKNDRVGEYEIKLMDIDQEHLGIPETNYDAEVLMSSSEFQKICRDLTVLGESVKIEVSKEGVRFSAEGEIGAGSVFLKPTSVGTIKQEVKDEDNEDEDAEEEHDDDDDDGSPKKKPKVKVEKKEVADMDEDEDEEPKDDEDESEIEVQEDDDVNTKPSLKKRKANGGAPTSPKKKKAKKGESGEDEDTGVVINLQQGVSLTFSLKYLLNFAKSAPLASKVSLKLTNDIPLLVGFTFEQGYIHYFLAPKIGDE